MDYTLLLEGMIKGMREIGADVVYKTCKEILFEVDEAMSNLEKRRAVKYFKDTLNLDVYYKMKKSQ